MNWEHLDAAQIEVFHGEAMEQFHKLAKEKGITGSTPVLDGIDVNNILANFKVKIMKAYGISSDPV